MTLRRWDEGPKGWFEHLPEDFRPGESVDVEVVEFVEASAYEAQAERIAELEAQLAQSMPFESVDAIRETWRTRVRELTQALEGMHDVIAEAKSALVRIDMGGINPDSTECAQILDSVLDSKSMGAGPDTPPAPVQVKRAERREWRTVIRVPGEGKEPNVSGNYSTEQAVAERVASFVDMRAMGTLKPDAYLTVEERIAPSEWAAIPWPLAAAPAPVVPEGREGVADPRRTLSEAKLASISRSLHALDKDALDGTGEVSRYAFRSATEFGLMLADHIDAMASPPSPVGARGDGPGALAELREWICVEIGRIECDRPRGEPYPAGDGALLALDSVRDQIDRLSRNESPEGGR